MATAREAKDAIVTVGNGRGFLAKLARRSWSPELPVVVTAAHCLLGGLPAAHPHRLTEEVTYAQILGPLGAKPTVWAECLFADPIMDLAILGAPDTLELPKEVRAYEQLITARPTLRIGAVMRREPARVLTLDGQWEAADVDISRSGRTMTVFGARVAIGMSGSPILHRGCAVGIISSGEINPSLVHNLPSWLIGLMRIRR